MRADADLLASNFDPLYIFLQFTRERVEIFSRSLTNGMFSYDRERVKNCEESNLAEIIKTFYIPPPPPGKSYPFKI